MKNPQGKWCVWYHAEDSENDRMVARYDTEREADAALAVLSGACVIVTILGVKPVGSYEVMENAAEAHRKADA